MADYERWLVEADKAFRDYAPDYSILDVVGYTPKADFERGCPPEKAAHEAYQMFASDDYGTLSKGEA